jgi:hypothetical protein
MPLSGAAHADERMHSWGMSGSPSGTTPVVDVPDSGIRFGGIRCPRNLLRRCRARPPSIVSRPRRLGVDPNGPRDTWFRRELLHHVQEFSTTEGLQHDPVHSGLVDLVGLVRLERTDHRREQDEDDIGHRRRDRAAQVDPRTVRQSVVNDRQVGMLMGDRVESWSALPATATTSAPGIGGRCCSSQVLTVGSLSTTHPRIVGLGLAGSRPARSTRMSPT